MISAPYPEREIWTVRGSRQQSLKPSIIGTPDLMRLWRLMRDSEIKAWK